MYNFEDVYSYSRDLTILFVEDDENLLNENQIVFENFFSNVVTAIDGVDALEKYKHYKEKTNNYFDLIITDINMPNMNGMELITEIRKLHQSQSIIVVSAYSQSDKLIDMIQLGIDSFILKPIKIEQLLNVFYKVCEHINILKQKESFLLSQSRNAAMGEMIDSIAHQWKQPINIINMKADFFYEFAKDGDTITLDMVKNCRDGVTTQVKHLNNTLTEFRNFFRPNIELKEITYKELVDSVLVLLKDNIIKHTVETKILLEKNNINVEVIPNEFKHILINIINNAIEAFCDNKKEDRNIVFSSTLEDKNIVLHITDNAGGIPKDIIENIFKLNYTTKEQGTGVGLYLSTQIIEKIGGNIKVSNTKDGARFSISLPILS